MKKKLHPSKLAVFLCIGQIPPKLPMRLETPETRRPTQPRKPVPPPITEGK